MCNDSPDVCLNLCKMLGRNPSRSTTELARLDLSIADAWRTSKAEAPHGVHDSKLHEAGGCMLSSIAAQRLGPNGSAMVHETKTKAR